MTFFYNIQQGFKNIWRNKMFSVASIATMTACIFLFGIFYSVEVNFNAMVHNVEENVAVTVFFVEGITQEQIDDIGAEIRKRPEVLECNFISADEAWERAKDDYFGGNEEVWASFAGDNPLAQSASYEIYLSDVSRQASFVSFLEKLEGVRQVNQSEVAANTLMDFNKLVRYISIGVMAILISVAVFLISNTVTVGVSVRREEIGIMKLIGARDRFVRAPFIVEGVTIGLIGSIIPLVMLFFMYRSIIVYITGRFRFLSGMLTFVPIEEVFSILVPVSLLLGVGIGFFGSRLTLIRHLKV